MRLARFVASVPTSAAERGERLLALGLELRVSVVDDPLRLDLGLLTGLRDDLVALFLGFLADLAGLLAGVGGLRLELLLGLAGVGLGLVELGELLCGSPPAASSIARLIGGMTKRASR